MNITQLRAELEELEQAGYGRCRVSVYPALSEDAATGRYILDFNGTEYAACELDVPPSPSDGLVTLVFDLAAEPDELVQCRPPPCPPAASNSGGERRAPPSPH